MQEKLDRLQIKNDLERLGRDIKLRMYFKDNPTPAFAEKPTFKVDSTWTPSIRDVELEFYRNEIEDKLLNIDESGKSYPNLLRDEREVLHSLMNVDKILIKPADKGSAIVVWSKKDYLTEAVSQLKDMTVYQKCQSAPFQKEEKYKE